ncbi:hypothetical protein BOTBODRAFT_35795 [Botryobasidium botryosum FD-172 SS1]|uniref:F-box domain-containing protein n=1 Tax=Botryobasidium botryosum (strain FD-172 SS1) TaxID=930990 RepID=A0A067MGM7_BOTB1|nr:hypothetical protein BOTBODRAFT_35795 [Botryobasidium botryosum FD-172 SS1]
MMDVPDKPRDVVCDAERHTANSPSTQQELVELYPGLSGSAGTSIDGLPAELLSEIFVLSTRYCGVTPSTFCLVNRAWHALAINTPQLWCNLDIQFRQSDGTAQRTLSARAIDTRIALSRGTPIDVTIQFARRSFARHSPGTEQEVSNIFNSIRPSMSRWRSLSIVEATPFHIYLTLQECAAAAPSVEFIYLCAVYDDVYGPEWTLENKFRPTPKLQKLVLRSVHAIPIKALLTPPLSSAPPSFPWLTRLISLSITDSMHRRWEAIAPIYHGILRVLGEAVHLQYLTLNLPGIDCSEDLWPDGTSITMPSLIDLRLFCINVTKPLRRLITPALISLRIREGDIYPHPEYESDVARFFHQSTPFLRILRFANLSLHKGDFTVWQSVFSALPALEELCFVGENVLPVFILEFLARPHGGWICPLLRELVWLGATDPEDSLRTPGALIDLLTARNPTESHSITPADSPARVQLLGFPAVNLNDEQLGVVHACGVRHISSVGLGEVVEDLEYLDLV